MKKEIVNIYYKKGMLPLFTAPKTVDMNDYELVCKYPIFRIPGHNDYTICETLFRLFNWVDEGFQPNDPEIGFKTPDTVYHTSMSIGDIVEINGTKYIVDTVGFKKVG